MMSIIDKLSTTTSHCKNEAQSCLAPAVLEHHTGEKDPQKSLKMAMDKLGCTDEVCILTHWQSSALKPEGPRNTTTLLSNFDIDSVLSSWRERFPNFFATETTAVNFARFNLSLARVSWKQWAQHYDYFGCVVNTDGYPGPGKHWVCVFVDKKNKTVEFFNSSGNPPQREITEWMESTAKTLGGYTTVPVTNIQHQYTMTECGVYCLLYIRARLEGVPLTEFKNKAIPDTELIKFRKHLFINKG